MMKSLLFSGAALATLLVVANQRKLAVVIAAVADQLLSPLHLLLKPLLLLLAATVPTRINLARPPRSSAARPPSAPAITAASITLAWKIIGD
ncbi:MAG: hypothetical protein U0894_07675 [Pirellulales bacterium]